MLGSLSRWLRIGGYDAEYRRDTLDDALIEEAMSDRRILLTRDEALVKRAKKRGVATIYLENESDKEALSQIKNELGIKLDPTRARCPKCNHPINRVAKADIVRKVPKGTYKTIDEYWICRDCWSIYWQGSHWPKIVETLSNAGERIQRAHGIL